MDMFRFPGHNGVPPIRAAIRTLDAMQVAIVNDPAQLAAEVKRLHRSHRFLCAIHNPLTAKIALYASDASATDAVIAARTDYPKGEVVGEYEYLSKEAIAALAQGRSDSPLAQAMRHLGRVTEGQDHFQRPQLIL